MLPAALKVAGLVITGAAAAERAVLADASPLPAAISAEEPIAATASAVRARLRSWLELRWDCVTADTLVESTARDRVLRRSGVN